MASKLQVTASKLQVTASKLKVTASKLNVTASKLKVTPTKLQVTRSKLTSLTAETKAPFTLYRITSERSDFHTGFGCCLHYTTPIRYAPRSENHSALEVIQKVIRYVPEQCKQ